jgi:hypothetical protein
MARSAIKSQPAIAPADAIEQKIACIAAMNIDELRRVWRETFKSQLPTAFSKDLLARVISYRVQEDAFDGLSVSTARLLRSLSKPGVELPRRVKAGSIIVREHKGVLHEVLVTPDGFFWQGKAYDSLSIIAKTITGVSWNGPRFFGLRAKRVAAEASVTSTTTSAVAPDPSLTRSSGRRSSVAAGRRIEGAP